MKVNLRGWTLADRSDRHVIAGDLLLPPGGYVVLGRNGDAAVNGGVAVDYVYAGVAWPTATTSSCSSHPTLAWWTNSPGATAPRSPRPMAPAWCGSTRPALRGRPRCNAGPARPVTVARPAPSTCR
ncbi:MAG: hypothetical protein R2838_05895 [Caldilineaceae bacterium]